MEGHKSFYQDNQAVTIGKSEHTDKVIKYYDAKLLIELMIRRFNRDNKLGIF